jgi:hypothetical protein
MLSISSRRVVAGPGLVFSLGIAAMLVACASGSPGSSGDGGSASDARIDSCVAACAKAADDACKTTCTKACKPSCVKDLGGGLFPFDSPDVKVSCENMVYFRIPTDSHGCAP